MAGTITVTPQELRKIAEELRQYNESLKKQLQEMAAIKNSLNTKWEGTAKEAFNKKFEERATMFDVFYMAMQGYISVLLNIAERYENVERKNAALVNGSGGSGHESMAASIIGIDLIKIETMCAMLYGPPVNPFSKIGKIDFEKFLKTYK